MFPAQRNIAIIQELVAFKIKTTYQKGKITIQLHNPTNKVIFLMD